VIVCHCNVVTSRTIRQAVGRLRAGDPYGVVNPGTVFRCCNARPQYGACMPIVARIIEETLTAMEKEHARGHQGHRLSQQGAGHELTAVSQYWLHYRLLESWGFAKYAKKEREESIEEMQHADRLVARIVFLEGHPNLQSLDPLLIGQTIREVLDCDLKAEVSARELYREAYGVCRDAKDVASMELFAELLADEEGHIDFIETELALLDRIGEQNYGLLQAAAADAKK
jgi:bacterioferritin